MHRECRGRVPEHISIVTKSVGEGPRRKDRQGGSRKQHKFGGKFHRVVRPVNSGEKVKFFKIKLSNY